MVRSWNVAWFVQSRRQAHARGKMASRGKKVTWTVVFVVLATVSVFAARAQADPIVPVVKIRPTFLPVDEGAPGVFGVHQVDVVISNPSPTAALTVLDLLVALSNIAQDDPDRTDRLTLNGATRVVTIARCFGINIPAVGL